MFKGFLALRCPTVGIPNPYNRGSQQGFQVKITVFSTRFPCFRGITCSLEREPWELLFKGTGATYPLKRKHEELFFENEGRNPLNSI